MQEEKCFIGLYLNDTFDYRNSNPIPSEEIKVLVQIYHRINKFSMSFTIIGIENCISMFQKCVENGTEAVLYSNEEITIQREKNCLLIYNKGRIYSINENDILFDEIKKIVHNYTTKENPIFTNNYK